MPVAPDPNEATSQTIGRQEQDRAFEEWAHQWFALERETLPSMRRSLRHAFDAGVRYGLSLRGCCEEEKP